MTSAENNPIYDVTESWSPQIVYKKDAFFSRFGLVNNVHIMKIILGEMIFQFQYNSAVSMKYNTAGTVVWYHAQSHNSGNWSTSFALNYPLYVKH